MARLILTHDGVNLRDYNLDRDEVVLGRKPSNDIQLDDQAISGRHCRFVRESSEYLEDHFDYYVEDLGSTNGTKVNDVKIDRQLLKQGDVIKVGKHSFTYDTGQGGLEQTAIYLPD
jgi:pSer/pThr/pTyr-binding forkhead associated (FHA) protein